MASPKIIKDRHIETDNKEKIKRMLNSGDPLIRNYSGVNGKLPEKVPALQVLSHETVVKGNTNASIVFGNDKPQGSTSGLSSKLYSGTSTIDICAGRQSKRIVPDGYFVSNNFDEDAARVYISQLTEVDTNLNMPTYKLGENVCDIEGVRSTVSIIADCPRIVARDNIKIGTKHIGYNSIGLPVSKGGVDIIAGFDKIDSQHNLQPMVKGGNLLECLNKIIASVTSLHNTVSELFDTQRDINNALLSHTHLVDAGDLLTDEILGTNVDQKILKQYKDVLSKLMQNQKDFADVIVQYNSGLNSEKYILSNWNRVN